MITNITGHHLAQGKGTRGEIVKSVCGNAKRVEDLLLRNAKSMEGFNLLWCEEITAANPAVHYATNCYDPTDRESAPVTSFRGTKDRGIVLCVGNDVLDDDPVKATHIKEAVEHLLKALPVLDASASAAKWAAHKKTLRNQLAEEHI